MLKPLQTLKGLNTGEYMYHSTASLIDLYEVIYAGKL